MKPGSVVTGDAAGEEGGRDGAEKLREKEEVPHDVKVSERI